VVTPSLDRIPPTTSNSCDGLVVRIPIFSPIIKFLAIEASPIDVSAPPLEKFTKELVFSATSRELPPTFKTFDV